MVPKGWSSVQAQDVCKSISVGVVIKPTQYYVPEGYGVKAFRSANVREGFINDSDWVYFSHEGHAINKKSHLKTGDVLIVRTGYPGTACVVTPEFEGSNAIDIVIARPDMDKIIPEYLCAYTNSHIGKSQVLDLQGGMAQKHLNVGAYQVLKINLPPLREQKKIAQILLTWDNAISVTEKLLTNSQQQKKALMQQLLTGKKRLLDENGVRFSGEWRNSTLSMFCNIAKGKALSASDLEVGDFPVIAGGKSSPYSHSDYTHENVVTVSASGAYAGYISYHNYKIWASDCSVVSAKADNLIDYFYQLLLSLQDKIYSLQSGGAQPHIYPKDLNSIPLWVPCVKEQQKIAAVLSAADAEISTLEKKLACLRDEKKALMQQLLTGKRRVKVDEAVAE
ncbi:restriction endonuclease subunit S [Escherichia coli]|uniref:restriction endonuclease subunit S n=1 Tax=Escherichia coli TaxID=562 RepID=UPI000A389797|nr:restriction endonuclease subunit S [Escherichia coli]EHG3076916.1 restriction endonuclease subunit S [Salmonella enterica]EAC2051999.1 restriction endonuclease subunit S [Escherichia coli]EEX0390838.1 restriction endonuclease subunit S [Escherichia coli]EFG8227767.1 restriction endonuclease subunit S [Escherichia coli]EFM2054119.1 restriction endonuclease subunit S [Escherichia coli]